MSNLEGKHAGLWKITVAVKAKLDLVFAKLEAAIGRPLLGVSKMSN